MAVAEVDQSVERVGWSDFLASFDWRPDEHVSVFGHTRAGKTTLIVSLLHRRKWTVVLGTKPRDATLSRLITATRREPLSDRFVRVKDWPPPPTVRRPVLWPDYTGYRNQQAGIFRRALTECFRATSWCVVADDARYLCDQLRLADVMTELWIMGASSNVPVVAAANRPAWVPLEMTSAATHLFMARESDRYSLRRLGELGGSVDTDLIRHVVRNLNERPGFGSDLLYVNTRTGQLAITRVERTG